MGMCMCIYICVSLLLLREGVDEQYVQDLTNKQFFSPPPTTLNLVFHF